MEIVCTGLNHQTAPVELRERLAVPEHRLHETLDHALQTPGIDEAVILSTCNRVEIYAAGPAPDTSSWLASRFSLDHDARTHLYHHRNHHAIHHLFEVVAGLDSMVLGETEIFGQVKNAYAAAHARGTTRRILNQLFQRSFAVGKRLRNQTGIQRGATSVGSVAVELAERIFGKLADCHVMLLGAGEMSRQTAQALLSRGARGIIVSNRSHDRAIELATKMGGEALHFDQWPDRIAATDIVIASTAAPHIIVTRTQIEAARRLRRHRPLFMIDISVPRNIDPAIHQLDDVYLYDIDALQSLADEARRQREQQITLCRQLITREIATLPP